jgi:nitrogen fixation NifU-like protein
MNLKELYQEIILEHGKNPRNLGKTDNFNKDAKGNNPLCGDNVHVYLKLNDQRKVEDISFEGSGCAISMASASIMTDLIKGKSDNEAKEIIEDFLGMIKENPDLKSNIKKIYDPELPVNIYDLGLIYEVRVNDKKAKIKMTLTTPNCPVAESLPKEVKEGAMQVEEIEDVDLELVWDPPWTKDMMSDAAKLELNL